MIANNPPSGAPKPAISTIFFGKNVQYPNKNKHAVTKTDGIHAFVLVPINSPA